jgi:hypothetical protein
LIAFFQNEGRRRALWQKLVAARLILARGNGQRAEAALALCAVRWGWRVHHASAQPQYGFTWQEAKRRGRDVIIAIDT